MSTEMKLEKAEKEEKKQKSSKAAPSKKVDPNVKRARTEANKKRNIARQTKMADKSMAVPRGTARMLRRSNCSHFTIADGHVVKMAGDVTRWPGDTRPICFVRDIAAAITWFRVRKMF